jgi:hypothetical protein
MKRGHPHSLRRRRASLIIGFWLQCNSKPLDTDRIAGFVEQHSCNANAPVIPFGDQARKQIQLAVESVQSCGVVLPRRSGS